MVMLWVTPPPVAVMVTESEPVCACLLAVKVSVAVPEPGAAIVLGLKETWTPFPLTEVDRLILELNPPVTAVVMVSVTEVP